MTMTLNLVIRIEGEDAIERAADVRAAIVATLADLTSQGVIHSPLPFAKVDGDDGWNWQI